MHVFQEDFEMAVSKVMNGVGEEYFFEEVVEVDRRRNN